MGRIMPKDNVVRFCLISIVLLLAVIAWRVGPSNVLAADPEQYLVTDATAGRIDPGQTKALNNLHAQGWKLVYVGWGTSGLLVWSK
jgi:hypothetical protein